MNNTQLPTGWEEEFRHNWEKIWEISPRNITTREGIVDFISNLITQTREATREEVLREVYSRSDSMNTIPANGLIRVIAKEKGIDLTPENTSVTKEDI